MNTLNINNIPRIFSIPRSGSTIMYNIISYIIKSRTPDNVHINIPEYTHNIFDYDGPVILMYRDFRNVHVSLKKFMQKNDDVYIYRYVTNKINVLNKMNKLYPSAYKLKYEDWENDIDVALDLIENVLKISLSDKEIDTIHYLFSRKTIQNHTNKLGSYKHKINKSFETPFNTNEDFQYKFFSKNHISKIQTNWQSDLSKKWINKYLHEHKKHFINYGYTNNI